MKIKTNKKVKTTTSETTEKNAGETKKKITKTAKTVENKTPTEPSSATIPAAKKASLKPKFKKHKAEKTEKTIKVMLNLTKCSEHWKKLPTEARPEPVVFKRQIVGKKSQPPQKKPVDSVKSNGDKSKIWFDVDNIFLPEANKDEVSQEIANTLNDSTKLESVESRANLKITRAVAIDCEMVGVGENGKDSVLARVSLVNQFSDCIYDKYVMPTETVTDYRTKVGIYTYIILFILLYTVLNSFSV